MHLMRTIWVGLGTMACAGFVQAAQAVPPYSVPDHQWTKKAWQCGKADASHLEIQSLRRPTSTVTNLKISGLAIGGRKVASSGVRELDDFVSSLDAVHTISGYCGTTGESVSIEGFVRGRDDPNATERKEFYILYAR